VVGLTVGMPGRPVPAQERGGGLPRGGRPAPGLWRALCGRERACGMRASCGRLGAVPFKSAREEIVRRAARIRRLQTPRAAVTLGDSSALLSTFASRSAKRQLAGCVRRPLLRCTPHSSAGSIRGSRSARPPDETVVGLTSFARTCSATVAHHLCAQHPQRFSELLHSAREEPLAFFLLPRSRHVLATLTLLLRGSQPPPYWIGGRAAPCDEDLVPASPTPAPSWAALRAP